MGRYDLDATPVSEVDARVTLGVKGPNGAPTGKDRFWVTLPTLAPTEFTSGQGKKHKSDVHPLHPAFERWHKEATAEERRSLLVTIEAATIDRAVQLGRAAPKAPGGRETPSKGDWCRSTDRGWAEAWNFDKNLYERRACAQAACPQAPICKPKIVMRARLTWADRWADLPSVRFLLRSRGWGSAGGGKGLVDELDEVWLGRVCAAYGIPVPSPDTPEARREAGIPDWCATGLRLRLELREHTKDSRRWWAVHTFLIGTVEEWLASQPALTATRPKLAALAAPVDAAAAEVDEVFGVAPPRQREPGDDDDDDDGEDQPELTPRQQVVVDYLTKTGTPIALASARVGGRLAGEGSDDDIATIKGWLTVRQREAKSGTV